jgi:hypothetical protein
MEHEEDVKGYLSDLTQAGTQKLGLITAEVDNLVKHLKESVKKVGRRGCVIHIAHSQGALITSLATKQLLPEEMKRIEVLAFGGAAALRKTATTPFKRCINYYAVNDPLLMVVPTAAQALRSGFFVGDGRDDEFCFLAPRAGDPIRDHNLWGPTYAQALQWEGIRFQRLYVNPLIRSLRYLIMLIVSVFQAFSQKLHDVLKLLLRPILVWCHFVYLSTRALSYVSRERMLRPLVILTMLLHQSIQDSIRSSWAGQERYEPASAIIRRDKRKEKL